MRMSEAFKVLCLLLTCGFMPNRPAAAQHPIEVQRLAAKGDFFEALRIYDKMPRRKTTPEAAVAAGKAAWALSLPNRAIEEFEKALQSENLDDVQRGRLLLSRGIIEYQENRHRVAILYAEKALGVLKQASPLRAKAWLLWGESLSRLKSYGAAEHKYLKALEESPEADAPAIHYLLGVAQQKLGKLKEARENLEKIPLYHDDTPNALRRLAEISLAEKKFEEAAFWLKRGRRDYPESFLDSWVEYALLEIAIQRKDKTAVAQIQEAAQQKYPPSDAWLSLLNAAAEEYRWRDSHGEEAK